MTFKNLHTFIFTKCAKNFLQILTVLTVNHFSSILRCKDNMVLAHPFRMCKAVCFICHKGSPFILQYGLNNYIVSSGRSFWYNHRCAPAQRVVYLSRACCPRQGLQPYKTKGAARKQHLLNLKLASLFCFFYGIIWKCLSASIIAASFSGGHFGIFFF